MLVAQHVGHIEAECERAVAEAFVGDRGIFMPGHRSERNDILSARRHVGGGEEELDLVALLEQVARAAGHASFGVVLIPQAHDAVLVGRIVVLDNHSRALAVEVDGDVVQVVAVALLGQRRAHVVAVDGQPVALEVVGELASLVRTGHVVVGAQVAQDVELVDVHVHLERDLRDLVEALRDLQLHVAVRQDGLREVDADLVLVDRLAMQRHVVVEGRPVVLVVDAVHDAQELQVRRVARDLGVLVEVVLVGDLQWVVDRQARCLAAVAAVGFEHDRVVDCLGDRVSVRADDVARPAHEVAEVDHVHGVHALVAVALCLASALIELAQTRRIDRSERDVVRSVLERRRDGLDLREIDRRQRCRAGSAHVRALVVVRLADDGAQVGARRAGMARQPGRPLRVIPARARLGLFGGDHVACIRREDFGGFKRGHQARVEADDVKLRAARLHRVAHLGQRERVGLAGACVRIQVVEAHARDRASTVVPDDQHVMIGGVLLHAPVEEVGERRGDGHRGGRHLFDLRHVAVFHLVALEVAGTHRIVLPFLGAASLDDVVDVVAQFGLRELDEVASGQATAHAGRGALEIRAAHVHEHGPGVVGVSVAKVGADGVGAVRAGRARRVATGRSAAEDARSACAARAGVQHAASTEAADDQDEDDADDEGHQASPLRAACVAGTADARAARSCAWKSLARLAGLAGVA